MGENILDHSVDKANINFCDKSKTNLKYAALFVLGALLLSFFSNLTGFLVELFLSIGTILFVIAVVISFIGFLNGVKSYFKKEKNDKYRFLVLLGNFLIFVIFLLPVFANVLDIIRFINE